ncbi:receptor-like protein 36 [Cryptomeria japonica]|uniref:receptor-like protein 36 n=1 Tax=Cryptomeria japonica TaxID=3369 RepID=UPI0027DA0B43|nr:receptor-like protein 36 [Cryptomeria japonica]
MAPMVKLFVFTVVILLFVICFCCRCIEREQEALLQFKAGLNYSSGSFTNLSAWEKGGDCCVWDGITCDADTHYVVRVVIWLFGGGVISESLCTLTSLATIDLTDNGLTGTLPHCLGKPSSLTGLHLPLNSLSGSIPLSFGNMSSLTHLNLAENNLTGSIPSFSNLSSLYSLDLSSNQLTGSIPSSLSNLSSLISLDLSYNKLTGLNGTLPFSFSKLSSLTRLLAKRNAFNRSIASSALPSSLKELSLTFNGGETISEAFFHNLSKLEHLSLSNCIFNNSPSWIPSFQLRTLVMTSCKMDSQIPSWISTQFKLYHLELADNNLVGEIPSWLQDISLQIINLTTNHLEGRLLLSTSAWKEMAFLDVSNNALFGEIPSIWSSRMEVLSLNNNSLTGQLPKSIGNISELRVLSMRKNNFEGRVPTEIVLLKHLQILDLSSNCFSGLIPHGIFNLQAILVEPNQELSRVPYILPPNNYMYKNGLKMDSKGRDENYAYIFPSMASIVLSYNQLNGAFPYDLGKLKGLKLLNLSWNNFNGTIPNSIVQMSWLESLDFSTNNISEQIPSDPGTLSYLGALNFSNNNLSGSIPQGGQMTTFTQSSF